MIFRVESFRHKLLFLLVLCCIAEHIGAFTVSRGKLLDRRSFTPVAPSQQKFNLATSHLAAAVSPGDTILVIGGTGGVGQLVTKKLQGSGDYKVRVTSRDESRGRETIGDSAVEVVAVDLIARDSAGNQALEAALEGVSAVVISVGTTAFPTTKWAGGNTPEAIDKVAVETIAKAAANVPGIKRVVLLTSVGVNRTNEMPFKILNLFGVLDAKRSGENAVIAAAKEGGFEYAILRPGRLIGGPYTNLDVAKLLQIEGGAENGVTVELGDSLLGDCKRDACAEAVFRCLTIEECKDVAFSIISNDDKALTTEQWNHEFVRLRNG